MVDVPPDSASEKPKSRKPHALTPAPPAPAWQEEISGLKDVSDSLAVSLWRMLRCVRLWSDTEPGKREGLFNLAGESQESMGYACAEAPQLIEPFGTFAFMRRAPSQASNKQVAEACRQVVEWAESHSLMQTAMHFAEAAAIVAHEAPSLSRYAATMCRRCALYDRSASWYERAYELAVRLRHTNLTASRDESIRALLGYGSLMHFLGRFEEAQKFYQLAAKRARRFKRRSLAAQALHDLLTFSAELGPYDVGLEYAASALDLYSIHAPQIPGLAHDWGFLLVQNRFYTHSVPVLKLAASLVPAPGLQALFWGTLARAAAGAGRVDLAGEAKHKAFSRIQLFDEYAPAVLIHLTEATRALGQWDEARSLAELAVQSARERQVIEPERIALDLVEQVKNHVVPPREEQPPESTRIELLNRRMLARLRQWKAPGSSAPEAPPKAPQDRS